MADVLVDDDVVVADPVTVTTSTYPEDSIEAGNGAEEKNDQGPEETISPAALAAKAMAQVGLSQPRERSRSDEATFEPQTKRKYDHEDAQHPNWPQHQKHILVFSAAGKPIFSRYGNESKLSGTTCVLQAFVAFVADQGDELHCITAGRHRFVFLMRGSIYLVAISRTTEPVMSLQRQLSLIYDQILFLLTAGINKVFKTKEAFDLRDLLGGTEQTFSSLIRNMNCNPGFFLGSTQSLRLAPAMRGQISQALHAEGLPDLLYALVVARDQVVSLVRPKRHLAHADDLLLIMNVVNANKSFRVDEQWVPMCLPRFNERGFLHCYLSYLAEDICLLLVVTKDDMFSALREARERVGKAINDSGSHAAIHQSLQQPYTAESVGVAGVRHFLYKSRVTGQFTCPAYAAPYSAHQEQKRLLRLYQQAHYRLHHQVSRPSSLCFFGLETEAIYSSLTKDYEIHVTFAPMLPKAVMVSSVANIIRWIKREEDSLFMNQVLWS